MFVFHIIVYLHSSFKILQMFCVIVILSWRFSSECQATNVLDEGWWTGSLMMLLRIPAPVHHESASPSLLIGCRVTFCDLSLVKLTLCVVSTPFLQNTIPGSCSGLQRCSTNPLPLLSLVASLSRSALIGWPGDLADVLTPPQRLLHITQQNHQCILRIMNICSSMFLSMNEQLWSYFICL